MTYLIYHIETAVQYDSTVLKTLLLFFEVKI